MKAGYSVYEECLYEIVDSGPWLAVMLEGSGDNLNELLQNCTVSHVDQDGGGHYCGDVLDDDKAIAYLERLTSEKIEDTEYYKGIEKEREVEAEKHRVWTIAQKAIPCIDCGDLKGNDWYYMGKYCRPCDIRRSKICYKCGGVAVEYRNCCAACIKIEQEADATCECCYETKPGGNNYFIKWPDCGPGGNDIEMFSCKECAETPTGKQFSIYRNARKPKPVTNR